MVQINNATGDQHESYSSEEGKVVMIVDTSEAYSSDNMPGPNQAAGSSNSEHSQGGGQANQEQDSYFKIKMHAMSCL